MIHAYVIEGDGIELRPLEEKDIDQLRIWRNDKEATKFLRPMPPISEEQQTQWFSNYKKDESILIFAIIDKSTNRFVGSVALYDFDEKTSCCEAGKIQIGDETAHGKGLASKAMALVSLLAFDYLGYSTVIATVHENNIAAYKSYMRIGFKESKKVASASQVGGYDILIRLTRESLLNSYPSFIHSVIVIK